MIYKNSASWFYNESLKFQLFDVGFLIFSSVVKLGEVFFRFSGVRERFSAELHFCLYIVYI